MGSEDCHAAEFHWLPIDFIAVKPPKKVERYRKVLYHKKHRVYMILLFYLLFWGGMAVLCVLFMLYVIVLMKEEK
jgi:hypothetical protein